MELHCSIRPEICLTVMSPGCWHRRTQSSHRTLIQSVQTTRSIYYRVCRNRPIHWTNILDQFTGPIHWTNHHGSNRQNRHSWPSFTLGLMDLHRQVNRCRRRHLEIRQSRTRKWTRHSRPTRKAYSNRRKPSQVNYNLVDSSRTRHVQSPAGWVPWGPCNCKTGPRHPTNGLKPHGHYNIHHKCRIY